MIAQAIIISVHQQNNARLTTASIDAIQAYHTLSRQKSTMLQRSKQIAFSLFYIPCIVFYSILNELPAAVISLLRLVITALSQQLGSFCSSTICSLERKDKKEYI
jgi:hypothetical protein